MKKFLLCILLIITQLTTVVAQSADFYFIKMPLDLLPDLPVNSRKDLVDFYKNERTSVMPSAFGGEMTVKEMSSSYLYLQTSSVTSLQMKLLPLNDSVNIISLIYTSSAPLKHSVIKFFDTDWKVIDSIKPPKADVLDFFDKTSAGSELSVKFKNKVIRNFIEFSFDKDSDDLILTNSVKEDLQGEFLPEFDPFLKKSIRLKWQKGKF